MSEEKPLSQETTGQGTRVLVYAMVFVSGFAGLVYQVLWMKQLGLLFGNTSHAAAATLAAFFAGLAVGSWFWGKRAKRVSNPMRVYAGLEVGIAVTALLYFAVLWLFYLIYPVLYQNVASHALLLVAKFILALILIFPPAFCMGGTIPIIGQALIKNKERFGIQAAWLYGINTLGAALGAFVAGFFLVRYLGFRLTCIGAMVLTGLVAAAAFWLALLAPVQAGKGAQDETADEKEKPARKGAKKSKGKQSRQHGGRGAVYAVCFLSGFGVLALEVLWTRMFAQVHENSIYSFSAVLVIVLIALSVGAMIASWLSHLRVPPLYLLAGLLLVGGLSVMVSPFIFRAVTNDFEMMQTDGTFASYVLRIFGKGSVFMGIPALLLGIVFPFLMKTEERFSFDPGSSLGKLSAVNTVGAILGSMLCGFVMLGNFGMWRTMQLIAAVYLIGGILLPMAHGGASIVIRATGGILVVLLFTVLSPVDLRVTGRDPSRPREKLVELWEASDCTVSVVVTETGNCVIKVNSNYSLGSTGAVNLQDFQGRLPLLAFPDTRSVFFLGMGTGMSAGGALNPQFKNLERVVVCELSPEVVTAARKYMGGNLDIGGQKSVDYTNGLFEDKRVEIVVDDGRHYLMATDSTFDMINADLFLPYRSGAGSLYSQEHFETVKEKLNPGGVFVQWVPMYQVTEAEFGTITRTMLSVFEQVTLWRNNFQPGGEVMALVGHKDATPVPASSKKSTKERVESVFGKEHTDLAKLQLPMNESTALLFYSGNITKAKDLFEKYPINTDDRPIIEYTSPLSLRKKMGDEFPPTMVGPRAIPLLDKIMERCPPDKDPMLVNRSAANRRLPVAGVELHRAWVGMAIKEPETTKAAWKRFVREWTNQPDSEE